MHHSDMVGIQNSTFLKKYALLDPFRATKESSRRNRNILLDVFCLRSCILNFILSEYNEYNILSAHNGRMIKKLV